MGLLSSLIPGVGVAEKVAKYGPPILKFVGKILLGVALLVGAYFYGKQAQRLEYEQAAVAQVQQEVKDLKDEASERTETAEEAGARQELIQALEAVAAQPPKQSVVRRAANTGVRLGSLVAP